MQQEQNLSDWNGIINKPKLGKHTARKYLLISFLDQFIFSKESLGLHSHQIWHCCESAAFPIHFYCRVLLQRQIWCERSLRLCTFYYLAQLYLVAPDRPFKVGDCFKSAAGLVSTHTVDLPRLKSACLTCG